MISLSLLGFATIFILLSAAGILADDIQPDELGKMGISR